MIQLGGILGRFLGPLLKTGQPLVGNVFKPLAKSVLVPLGLTAAKSAKDAAIHKIILGSGTTTLIFSNKDLNDNMKIVKSLKDSGLWVKGVNEIVENEVKEQKGGFLGMLAATLASSLLGNMLKE